MRIALGIVGVGLVLLVALDVLWTTLRLAGAGPLTSWVVDGLWKAALWIVPTHRSLALVGFAIPLFTVSLWLGLDWLGWSLVLNSHPAAVVLTQGGQAVGFWERMDYAGALLITVGNSDYRTLGDGWKILTVLAAANGFTLVSLTITYLVPLVSAVRQRREVAVCIRTLGAYPQEVLLQAWNGTGFGLLEEHLLALTHPLVSLGQGHLAYPVLHCFHSAERDAAIAPSVAVLDEALTLLDGVAPEMRPDPTAIYPLRGAIEHLLSTLREAHLEPESVPPQPPSLVALRQAGIPTVSDEEMEQRVAKVSKRRRLLLGLVVQEGWKWRDVMTPDGGDSRR